jgi:hypothetical protein
MKRIGLLGAAAAALVSCGLVVTSPTTSEALDVRRSYNPEALAPHLSIHLEGEIERGDLEKILERIALPLLFERLEAEEPGRYQIIPKSEYDAWRKRWEEKREHGVSEALADTPPQAPASPRGPLTITVRVHSVLGGDVNEAMRIGRWMRQNGAHVSVSIRGVCASACVFILAAGLAKSVLGDVIIHRPFFTEMPVGDVGVHLQELIVETRAYLAEMNIPESLADEMFSIRPEDGVVLSVGALTHYRLNTNDIVYQEKADLRRAEQLGISRFELIRRRQAYEHALELGACEDIDLDNYREYEDCLAALYRMHGLSTHQR